MNKQIILASASPRRKMLLEQLGMNFRIVKSEYEENLHLSLPPHKLVEFLAKEKARDVARKQKDAIIIGADTIVLLGSEVIGKPKSLKDAKQLLKKLSGKMHTVITGVCVIDGKTGKSYVRSVQTRVYFRKLKLFEIDSYIQKENVMDKAGAYAMQEGTGALLIEKIEGDYFNVVGLPLVTLIELLKKFGVSIL